jgi:formate/nitrite transporter FocA (FNT family)
MGILLGAQVTWQDALVRNLIPVCVGNAIAGVFIVALTFALSYGRFGRQVPCSA